MQEHNQRVLIFFAVIVILMAIVLPIVYVNQEKIEERKKTEQAYNYTTVRYAREPQFNAPSAREVTVTGISEPTGKEPGGASLSLSGSGFLSGDYVYFFLDAEKGDDLLKTVPTVSVTSEKATFVTPRLGSGVYTVGIERQGTRSDGIQYTVHLASPSPEFISKESVGTSWDEKRGDSYTNPRLYTASWKVELTPADTALSATEWCKTVPQKGYTSGTPYVSGGYAENYKYSFDGSQWVRLIQGDYVRYITCK
jgi:hypothetical protein